MQRQVICFFDINDTMYIGDTAKGVTKEIAVAKLLAEKYIAVWDPAVTKEAMTFKDFVENHLSPGNRRDPDVQAARNLHYQNFIAFLASKSHPLTNEIEFKFNAILYNLRHGNIPESFIRFIKYLQASQQNFTIIFRTFGDDSGRMLKELKKRAKITIVQHGSFNQGRLLIDADRLLTTPQEMLDNIAVGQHAVWQDNFTDWQAAKESHEGGKPFPLDFTNDEVVSIFFDDNVSKKILGVKPTTPLNIEQAPLQKELIRLGRIVPVDTYSVCMDNDYFINKFKAACVSKLDTREILNSQSNLVKLSALRRSVELATEHQKQSLHK